MKNVTQAVLFAALTLSAHGLGSTTLAGSNTFVDLRWTLSGPAAAGCTDIWADATGDASRSNKIIIYGALNCPSIGGALPMTGVAYVGTDGPLNMSFNMGLV